MSAILYLFEMRIAFVHPIFFLKHLNRHIAGWDVLDNHAVNILMSTTSAIFGPLFFSVFYSYFK